MSIAAELHGKTPFDYSEDILTSDVFMTFRYLPPEFGLIGFLRSVEGLSDLIDAPDGNSTCGIYFWPRGRIREPDVLLELEIRGKLYHVVVEAKYRSGASDWGDGEPEKDGDSEEEDGNEIQWTGNQLADQFLDLQNGRYWKRTIRWNSCPWELESAPGRRFLLYLTAHQIKPMEVLSSCHENCPGSVDRLFWANWYDVHNYLATNLERYSQPCRVIVEDLLALLRKKGFYPFQGIPRSPAVQVEVLPRYRWVCVPRTPLIAKSRLPLYEWRE